MKEIPAKLTPVKNEDMLYAMAYAWVQLFNEQPKKESLLVLLAQGALETGQFKKMWNYNIGNIKSVDGDGRDYSFYKCNELLNIATAKKLVASANADGGKAEITFVQGTTATVWFYPSNKYCRFRAFENLNEGAIDYMSFLHKRFNTAWGAVLDGNPQEFSHLLRARGYYTANEAQYTKGVVNLFNQFGKIAYDPSKLPVVSDQEKEKILNLVGMMSNELIEQD